MMSKSHWSIDMSGCSRLYLIIACFSLTATRTKSVSDTTLSSFAYRCTTTWDSGYFYKLVFLAYLERSSWQIHPRMTQSGSQFIDVKFSRFVFVEFDENFQPFSNSDPNSSEIFIAELANASWIASSNLKRVYFTATETEIPRARQVSIENASSIL